MRVDAFWIKDHIEDGEFSKGLLEYIKNAGSEELDVPDGPGMAHISRHDYNNCFNTNRDWVTYALPVIESKLTSMVAEIGFDGIELNSIWFQQYYFEDGHAWHTHAGNFTGVYYLELPENAQPTELVVSNKVICPEVKQGDIVVFPSHTIHRGPKIKMDTRKTIISYNFYVPNISLPVFEKLNYITELGVSDA